MASLIGMEIGKYRITERLGQGGMAEVYAGVHNHLDRKVAVKVLHSYLLEGGDFVDRFKREAKAVANLRHPNIVQVYDFDIQDDLIFMVMEYIDGVNLHAKLVEAGNRGERLPIKLIGSIINDIASALDYAHSKGMLHRDIKPSNIMIDSEDKAYLTDFGIAKLLSDQKFTATGTLVGTPAYMSPEQGLGDDVSKESDIYSLGVVAFEMLTGQVPYDAKTPIGIVHKQINDPIPDMSELVAGVPSTAQEVIDRALAKAPESRYSSAEDLVGALRTALTALEMADPIAIPAEEPPTVVDDGLEAPTVTMDADELEQPTVVMQEEKPAEEVKPKNEIKPKPDKEKRDKKKIPFWAYIAGAAGLLAVIGVALTQVLDLGFGVSPSTLPDNAIIASLHAEDGSNGLSIDPIPDGDFQDVSVGRNAGWQTGSGQVLPSENENDEPDTFLYFQIDDALIHELPEGSSVYIDVELLNNGSDTLYIDYDGHSGGEFTQTKTIQKTDSGEFSVVRFMLSDAFFGNRTNGADFRIVDNFDGEEIIRSVEVVYLPDGAEEDPQEEGEEPVEEGLSGEEYYNQAYTFFEEGDFPATIDFSYQAIGAGYENSEVYNLIGRAYRALGEYDQALDPLTTSIEMDPDYFWAYFNRGMVRKELGDLFGAIEDFTTATELNPDNWAAFYYLGESYYKTNDEGLTEQAAAALDRAIELDPGRSQAFRVRGELKMLRFSDLEGALEDANNAVDLAEPGDPEPYQLRGYLEFLVGDIELCISDLTYALELDPEHTWSYMVRGDCFAALDDVDPARQDYETFLNLAGNQEEYGSSISRVEEWLAEH